ncbi:MAG: homocysteine S-methyltransferase family protein [Actinomycetota bacterium]
MASGITILDGGMGKELLRIGAPFRQPEWSALALLEDPAYVRKAHQNFVDAGAEVIIVNTYAVVPYHLGADRFGARGAELATLAADIAREVADGADRPITVAASLPPLFGSYEPWNFVPEEAPALWEVLVEAQAGKVDVWLAETVSSLDEFRTVAAAVADRPEPFWASFSLDDELPAGADARTWAQLRSGESIAQTAAAVVDNGSTETVLFNCSRPERFEPAIVQLADALGDRPIGIGAYANAFEEKEEGYASNGVILEHRDDLTPLVYADTVQRWITAGASIVGGCCGIHPDHIRALADRFGAPVEV